MLTGFPGDTWPGELSDHLARTRKNTLIQGSERDDKKDVTGIAGG